MTGTLRLLLAMIVAAVHFRPAFISINVVGSSALVAFFVISGYAMTGLYESRFAGREGAVRLFYVDRILRIAPQYYFWMLVAIAILLVSHHSHGWHAFAFFQTGVPTVFNVLCNLSIWPVGFWPYFPTLATLQLVPPAWSLTIELTFYLLLPAMLARAWVVPVLAALALVAFCLATQGIIDPVLYAYRMLPAPLLYILLGHALYARKYRLLAIIYAVLAVDLAWVIATHRLSLGFNLGVFLGAIVGTALVSWSVRVRSWRFDDLFGRMSYGCYLGHWPLLTVIHPQAGHAWLMVPFAIASAWLGWLSYKLVDARLLKRRRRLAPPMVQSTNAPKAYQPGFAVAIRDE